MRSRQRAQRRAGRAGLARQAVWVVAGAGVLGAAGGLAWWLRSTGRGRRSRAANRAASDRAAQRGFGPGNGAGGRSGGRSGTGLERRSQPDREALQALVDGATSRVGLDLERLRKLGEANYHPLVEYLEYIQLQRGDGETLVFVRQRDIEKLAGLAGEPREEFLKRFSRLGIVLSMN